MGRAVLGGAGADSGIGRFLLHPPSCLSKPGPAAATATRRLRGAGKRREAGLAGRGGAGGRGLGGRALVPAALGREARLGLGARGQGDAPRSRGSHAEL